MEIAEDGNTENAGGTEEIKDPKAVLAALDRAKADAERYRNERNALQEKLNASSDGTEVNTWKSRALRAEARMALQEQGVKNPDRILKLVNVEDLSLDEQGGIVGLDEKVAGVKNDFPELFERKRQVTAGADIFADRERKVEKTVNDIQADILLGKG